MDRINTPTVDPDKWGAGKDGFQQLNPNDPGATQLNDEWFDGVQEELMQFIEASGQTGRDPDDTNLLTVQQLLIGLQRCFLWMRRHFDENVAAQIGTDFFKYQTGVGLTQGAQPAPFWLGGKVFDLDSLKLTDMGEVSHTFTAERDTYLAVSPLGNFPTFTFQEVPNGDPAPAPPVGSTHIVKVVTDLTNVVSNESLLQPWPDFLHTLAFKAGLLAESTALTAAGSFIGTPGNLGALVALAQAGNANPAAQFAHADGLAVTAQNAGGTGNGAEFRGPDAGGYGEATLNDGHGLEGKSGLFGSVAGSGVRAEGRNNAPALRTNAAAGNGADVQMTPRIGAPSQAQNGAIWADSIKQQTLTRNANTNEALFASPGGRIYAIDANNTAVVNTAPSVVATVTLTGRNTVKNANDKLTARFCADRDHNGAVIQATRVQVYDLTSANVVYERVFPALATGTTPDYPIVGMQEITVPAAGDRTYELRVFVAAAGETQDITNATLEIEGTHV